MRIFSNTKEALSWESEAITIIKEKIAHYKSTGNVVKLAIYEAKLKQKSPIISRLSKLLKGEKKK